jgi:hypothetical protein
VRRRERFAAGRERVVRGMREVLVMCRAVKMVNV